MNFSISGVMIYFLFVFIGSFIGSGIVLGVGLSYFGIIIIGFIS